MLLAVLLFTVGLVLLYFGAEYLVGGSSAIGLRLGITPLMIGLTVVAFGTSAPELLVSVMAIFSESDDISVGNIIGSNIANILLILGVSAMFRPMSVSKRAVKREFPFMVGASVLMTVFVYTGSALVWWEGVVFLIGMVVYLYWCFLSATSKSEAAAEEQAELDALDDADLEDIDVDPDANPALDVVKMVGGIIGLAGGAHLMVDNAITIASALGVSALVIGITVVAFGTSLPELATSVIAAVRDESDISVGNVIGSNIFNIFLVLGIVSVVTPLVTGHALTVGAKAVTWDIWIMLGVAVGIWPILRSGHRISRLEGFFMFAFYCGYVAFLFLRT
ncbi:MAG: calcium/sodium antiporter [Myxococcota bacterium]